MCLKRGMVVDVVRVEKEKSVFVCDIDGHVRHTIGLVYEQHLCKPMPKLISVVTSSARSQETCSRG